LIIVYNVFFQLNVVFKINITVDINDRQKLFESYIQVTTNNGYNNSYNSN